MVVEIKAKAHTQCDVAFWRWKMICTIVNRKYHSIASKEETMEEMPNSCDEMNARTKMLQIFHTNKNPKYSIFVLVKSEFIFDLVIWIACAALRAALWALSIGNWIHHFFKMRIIIGFTFVCLSSHGCRCLQTYFNKECWFIAFREKRAFIAVRFDFIHVTVRNRDRQRRKMKIDKMKKSDKSAAN